MNALILLALFGLGPSEARFDFAVHHRHLLNDCRGQLRITESGIEYQTTHAGDSRTWRFDEIRVVEVRSSTAIAILTHEDQNRYLGKDRIFEFTLSAGKIPFELSAFLLSKVTRPMLVAVLPESGKPAFELRAKHLHALGGATGVLRVYPDRVLFDSKKSGDSRVWRVSDIQRFAQPERFRFEITGYLPKTGGPTETYRFELFEEFPDGLYDYLWVRVNPSAYRPAR